MKQTSFPWFERGQRDLADLIAPGAVEVGRDTLRLDSQYTRTLLLTGYPRSVRPGWLSPLIELDRPLDLSLHLVPLDSGQVAASLSRQLVALHSSRRVGERHGRLPDPQRDVATGDIERLRDQLARGQEKAFAVSLYVLLRAESRAELEAATRQVEALLDGLLAHSRVAVFEQDAAFRACLPQGSDLLRAVRNLDSSTLATMFPFTANGLMMERGVFYGIARPTQSPVFVDPFDAALPNANLVVFAQSGAGKSYFTKLLALRHLLTGVELWIIDPEDEYRALAEAAGGQVIRLAGASPHHLNPLDLAPRSPVQREEDGDRLDEQVAQVAGLLAVLLAPGGFNAGERGAVDRAIYQAYRTAGLLPGSPETYARPAPLLGAVQAALQPIAPDLAGRLERFVAGSGRGLFSAPTDVALDRRRLVVFHLQSLEAELRPAALHLIAGFVWNQMRRAPRPRLLIVDEAWSLLQHPAGGAFLGEMARRARKYYLGLVTITQDVGDFLGSEAGRVVLGNAALRFLLRQDSTTLEPVAAAFALSAEERRYLLGATPGEGLLFAPGMHLALQVEASPLEHRLATTAPQEVYPCRERPGGGEGSGSAVNGPPKGVHGRAERSSRSTPEALNSPYTGLNGHAGHPLPPRRRLDDG